MKKPVFAMLLGGVLGVFDGLTALISAPETAPQIVGIVIGSTIKGIIAGLVIGLVAQRTQSLAIGHHRRAGRWCRTGGVDHDRRALLLGDRVARRGVGVIVGYATFKYRGATPLAH